MNSLKYVGQLDFLDGQVKQKDNLIVIILHAIFHF